MLQFASKLPWNLWLRYDLAKALQPHRGAGGICSLSCRSRHDFPRSWLTIQSYQKYRCLGDPGAVKPEVVRFETARAVDAAEAGQITASMRLYERRGLRKSPRWRCRTGRLDPMGVLPGYDVTTDHLLKALRKCG
jgi:hypothetical protein